MTSSIPALEAGSDHIRPVCETAGEVTPYRSKKRSLMVRQLYRVACPVNVLCYPCNFNSTISSHSYVGMKLPLCSMQTSSAGKPLRSPSSLSCRDMSFECIYLSHFAFPSATRLSSPAGWRNGSASVFGKTKTTEGLGFESLVRRLFLHFPEL